MKKIPFVHLLKTSALFGVCIIGYIALTTASVEFKIFRTNFRIEEYVLRKINPSSLAICALRCLMDKKCLSMSYRKCQNLCELNNASYPDRAPNSEADGWSFYVPLETNFSVLGSLALRQPAVQSSTYKAYGAGNAVDGNLNNVDISTSNRMHTDTSDYSPWWRVDLGDTFWITDVRFLPLRNSQDIYRNRVRNIYIDVFDDTNGMQGRCGFYKGPPSNKEWVKVSCTPQANGRIVKLWKGYSSTWYQYHLELTEVEVFGIAKWL